VALVVGAVGAVMAPGLAHAGAWTREQGEFYLQLGYTYGYSAASYNKGGAYFDWQNPKLEGNTATPLRGAHQTESSLGFYAEFGLLDALTMSVAWEAKFLSKDLGQDASELIRTGSASGIPEVRLGLRGRVIREPFILSIELVVGIPAQAPYLDPIKYDPQATVPIGLGSYNATAWTHLGKSWTEHLPAAVGKRANLYTNFALGFQYRDNFLNNFVFNLEIGAILFNYAFLSARYFGEKNVGAPHLLPGQFGNPDVFYGQTDQQRWAVSVGFVWQKYLFLAVEYGEPTGGTQSLAAKKVTVNVATSY
jgi:hypothetical protein